MPPAVDDRELLDKIRNGDPDAFEEFVAVYGDRIYGFGMRVCGEREDARDIVQDTLLKAYQGLEGIREPRALRSWLYRVALNACLMKRRKGKFEPRRELSLEELMPGNREEATAEIPDLSELPDEVAARHELQQAVRKAIRSLPPDYRVVLVLRDMEQFTTREAAEALGLEESTLKMRLHRARLMVKKQLHAELDSQERSGDDGH